MIKTIIQAGFGNQLFQYATGYALAKRLKQQLVLDTSFFDYVKGSNADNVRSRSHAHRKHLRLRNMQMGDPSSEHKSLPAASREIPRDDYLLLQLRRWASRH